MNSLSSAATHRKKQLKQETLKPVPLAVLIGNILASSNYDIFMGILICIHAFVFGVEQSFRIDGHTPISIRILEHVFLLVYLAELAARVYAYGPSCFKDRWVIVDTILNVVGVLYAWILDPWFGNAKAFKPLIFLRLIRLLRLARLLRLLIQMRELYTLLRALTNSMVTVCYTLSFLFISIYICSCIGVEIIANRETAPNSEFQTSVERYFKNLPVTMFTLIRFACLDDMSVAYQGLVAEDWTLAVYFVGVVVVVGIVFMNLLSAAVINSSLEQSARDRDALKLVEDKRRRHLVQELRKLFHRIDIDNSGVISLSEIKSMNLEDKSSICSAMGTKDLIRIFKQLDVDRSGSVDIDEFVDGMGLAMSEAPIELKRLEAKLHALLGHLQRNSSELRSWDERCDAMFSQMRATLRELRATFNDQEAMQASCCDSDLERENKVLKHQLLAADVALVEVLQKTQCGQPRLPPAPCLGA